MKLPTQTDTIYSSEREALGAFQFDRSVVAVFPDMISRSVPGYQTILTGIGELTQLHAQPHSRLYDLGCSLGAASLTMRRAIQDKEWANSCEIIGVDNSEPMIERANEYVQSYHSEIPLQLHCADINDFEIENASVVVLNFTLQFIPREQRQALLKRICDSLKPGGILILSEKIHFADEALQNSIEHMHLQFKRANGYSELEISQKRSSLDNVLISDTEQAHIERLKNVGFQSAGIWFQAYNFASFLAIK